MLRLASANLALQAITVLSKAVLFLVIARYLPLSEVGVFGLVALTLSLVAIIAALTIHTPAGPPRQTSPGGRFHPTGE